VLAVTEDGGGTSELRDRGQGRRQRKITALGGQPRFPRRASGRWKPPRSFRRAGPATQLRRAATTSPCSKPYRRQEGWAECRSPYLAGIVAAFRGTAPPRDLAMTGEITILGKCWRRRHRGEGPRRLRRRLRNRAHPAKIAVRGQLPADLRQAIEIFPVASVQEALAGDLCRPRRSKPSRPPNRSPPFDRDPHSNSNAHRTGGWAAAAKVAEPAAAPTLEDASATCCRRSRVRLLSPRLPKNLPPRDHRHPRRQAAGGGRRAQEAPSAAAPPRTISHRSPAARIRPVRHSRGVRLASSSPRRGSSQAISSLRPTWFRAEEIVSAD